MTDPSLALGSLVITTFFATAIQTLAGFAFALIMMPIVTMILGVHTAAPLVALTALTLYGVNLLRYHKWLNIRELWRLGAATTAGVPVGIWMVASANEAFVKVLLGLILIGYGLYALTRPSPQRPCSLRWAYLAGFVSGSLGGAYNTSGPPLAVYGGLRQWPKDEFRSGLQTLFFVSGALTVLSHAFANHLTPTVLRLYAWTSPLYLVTQSFGGRMLDVTGRDRPIPLWYLETVGEHGSSRPFPAQLGQSPGPPSPHRARTGRQEDTP